MAADLLHQVALRTLETSGDIKPADKLTASLLALFNVALSRAAGTTEQAEFAQSMDRLSALISDSVGKVAEQHLNRQIRLREQDGTL